MLILMLIPGRGCIRNLNADADDVAYKHPTVIQCQSKSTFKYFISSPKYESLFSLLKKLSWNMSM